MIVWITALNIFLTDTASFIRCCPGFQDQRQGQKIAVIKFYGDKLVFCFN